MATLLFEIGCEELPGGFCAWAEGELRDRWLPELGGSGRALVGPRRIAVLVDGFDPEAGGEEKRGPPESVAFDEVGPTSSGRLRSRARALRRPARGSRRLPLGTRGGAAAPGAALAHRRRPRYRQDDGAGIGSTAFASPADPLAVRQLDARDDTSVRGIPSGSSSFGHRFTSGEVEIATAADYEEALRRAGVVADAAERRAAIVQGLDALGSWSDPYGVLDEVVYLVESPLVLEGAFDERFARVPERVIVTAMQSHQRYFPLGGNRFAFVANGGDTETPFAPGTSSCWRRRLDDAAFTFDRDVAVGIDGLAERLGAITFFAGRAPSRRSPTGSASWSSGSAGEASIEAARLAKADQASELVREFDELEGVIGAEYARLAGYPRPCAPPSRSSTSGLRDRSAARDRTGKVLAAADRIDTLTVSFALGHKPTGSRDPFGLRRAAIGPAASPPRAACGSTARCSPTTCASSSRSRLEACSTFPSKASWRRSLARARPRHSRGPRRAPRRT